MNQVSSSQLETSIIQSTNLILSDYTPEEYKKLLKKIDRYLLPLMFVSPVHCIAPETNHPRWVCYGIQQTDKTSLGTQAVCCKIFLEL